MVLYLLSEIESGHILKKYKEFMKYLIIVIS